MKNYLKMVFALMALTCLSFSNYEKKEIIIVIDAAHGGQDFGANTNNVFEKEIVATITSKIKSLNLDNEVKIHFTRIEDSFVSLEDRTNFINKLHPDLVISLHVNQNKNELTNGFEAYVSDESLYYEKSQELASKIISQLEKNMPLENRGVKTGSFNILKNSNAPAILLELGFISNEKDKNYLTNIKNQTEIAQTILDFIINLKR